METTIGLQSGRLEEEKFGFEKGSKIWDGKKWVSKEEWGKDRRINQKTGNFYRGSQTLHNIGNKLVETKDKISSTLTGIGEKINDAVPEVVSDSLTSFSEAAEEVAVDTAGTMLNKVTESYMALSPEIRNAIQTSAAFVGQKAEDATIGLSQQFDVDPIITEAALGGLEFVATGGMKKPLQQALKYSDDMISAINIAKKLKLSYATDDIARSAIKSFDTATDFKPNTFFASEQLYDPNITKVNRDKGGAFGTGHRGLANVSYKDLEGFNLKFNKLRILQQEGPFKHHHFEDIAFTGKWANTSDFDEVFKELNKLKIYPGDSPTNIIGMMDEGNRFLQTGKTDLIQNLKKQNFPGLENIDNYGQLTSPKANQEVRRLIDDLFKSPEYSDDFFKGSIDKLGRKTDNQIGAMFETLPDGTRVPQTLPKDKIGFPTWERLGLKTNTKEFLSLPKKQQDLLKQKTWAKRWETLGIDRKSIKYDPTKMILSKDHIDTIHYKVYNSPKFTQKRELEKMIKDGSYHKLTAVQKAEKIAEVYRIQKNTSINVAKTRLKLIKNYLKEAQPIRYRDIYSKDPTKLRQWIVDNPSISANLGWKNEILDYKTLTKDPGEITNEFRTVFSTSAR